MRESIGAIDPAGTRHATREHHEHGRPVMTRDRKTAVAVGLLYIMGTVAGVLSVVSAGDATSASPAQLKAGSLFVILMGLSLAFIPIALYGILRRRSLVLAVGYIVFRGVLETLLYFAMATCWLVAASPVSGGNADAGLKDTLLATQTVTAGLILPLAFGAGALILYAAMYAYRLIPRWISLWGMVAIVMHVVISAVGFDNATIRNSTAASLMNVPIFVQEMFMAVWLIAKGFDDTAGPGTARRRG